MRRDLKKVRDTKDRTVLKPNKTEIKNNLDNVPKKKPGIVNQQDQKIVSDEMDDKKGEIYIEDSDLPWVKKEQDKEESEETNDIDEITGKEKNKIINSEKEIVNKKG